MKKINIEEDQVNLLWTGGWDSTFQLLQLLLIYKSNVVPYYLIHEDRHSTGMELKTIIKIKNYLLEKFPHTKDLLRPVQYFAVNDLVHDDKIANAYKSIQKEKHIGWQYEWLAFLCKEIEIYDMQLSVEKSLFPLENHWDLDIEKMLIADNENSQIQYIIDSKHRETNEYQLFKYFSFPIIKITKKEMSKISADKGWNEIMQMTWFCHNPTNDKKPCGKCKPCLTVIQEGFGKRISTKRRFVSFIYRKFIWPMKSIIKQMHSPITFR